MLGGTSIAFIHKTRDPRVPNEATVGKVVGEQANIKITTQDDLKYFK
jgi:ribose-phosphate pyrophosphokinase